MKKKKRRPWEKILHYAIESELVWSKELRKKNHWKKKKTNTFPPECRKVGYAFWELIAWLVKQHVIPKKHYLNPMLDCHLCYVCVEIGGLARIKDNKIIKSSKSQKKVLRFFCCLVLCLVRLFSQLNNRLHWRWEVEMLLTRAKTQKNWEGKNVRVNSTRKVCHIFCGMRFFRRDDRLFHVSAFFRHNLLYPRFIFDPNSDPFSQI